MYFEGKGVDRNLIEGCKWWYRAMPALGEREFSIECSGKLCQVNRGKESQSIIINF
ncbi:MAG: hypothetical protein K0M45_06865 [Candidatus Paracaedibacteraceae bacterium]|nr:hypothetical protein [Candidatus Paracaedibacteraceae bacterium]